MTAFFEAAKVRIILTGFTRKTKLFWNYFQKSVIRQFPVEKTLFQLAEISQDLSLQWGQIVINCKPKDLWQDLVIPMHQDVAHLLNLVPWSRRVFFFEFQTQHICGFANYLNVFHNSIVQNLVVDESLIVIAYKKLVNVGNGRKDMLQSSPIINSLSHKSRFCLLQRFSGQTARGFPLAPNRHPSPSLLPK